MTGIYDMSGGALEYVAAYVDNGHSCLTDESKGKALTEGAAKYKNVYYSTVSDGNAAHPANYEYANPNYIGTYPNAYTKKYGDAVWEMSSLTRTNQGSSWYSDSPSFPDGLYPFFLRGGNYNITSGAGVFAFGAYNGDAHGYGFRVVVSVL